MKNPLQDLNELISSSLRKGEENLIEFINSKVHDCEEKINDSVIFYTTPENELKYTLNSQSIYGFSGGIKVKCCMWCGFTTKETE